MKGKKHRSKFSQNRIDYIVYGNMDGASKLVYDYGYEPPKNPHDLVKATKILIRQNGRKVIKELIKLHPDRQAIMKIDRGKEDNFCGACSSYSYNPEDNYCGVCGHSHYDGGDKKTFLDQLVNMTIKELEDYYESVVRKSNENPNDNSLADEVEMVWNELRQKKAEAKIDSQEENQTEVQKVGLIQDNKDGLIILGLVFIAGVLVGSSLKTT